MINKYITAKEELKSLMELRMFYNQIVEQNCTDGMHTFFKMSHARFEEMLGHKLDEFYDYWIGNGEPDVAYEFAINNLKFEQEEINIDGLYERK